MSLSRWRVFVRNSVLERVPENDFTSLAAILYKQHYLIGRKLARVVVDCRTSICSQTDPIVLRYLRCLVLGNYLTIVDILSTIVEDWIVKQRSRSYSRDALTAALEADALIIQELAVLTATRQQTEGFDARACFLGCSKLLSAIIPQVGKSNGDADDESMTVDPALSLAEAICLLFATSSGLEAGVAALLDQKDEGMFSRRNTFVLEAEVIIDLRSDLRRFFEMVGPFLPLMSMEMRQRLEDVHKGLAPVEKPAQKGASAELAPTPDAAQFEMNVIEPGPLHSRAGLFVYLNAAVCVALATSSELTY